jgi:hypothetical protein
MKECRGAAQGDFVPVYKESALQKHMRRIR